MPALSQSVAAKKDFSTRLSPETLHQLDALVRSRKYRNRTAAIEAAVERLYREREDDLQRKRIALLDAAGALGGRIDRDRWRRAETDRLDWEAERASRRRSGSR